MEPAPKPVPIQLTSSSSQQSQSTATTVSPSTTESGIRSYDSQQTGSSLAHDRSGGLVASYESASSAFTTPPSSYDVGSSLPHRDPIAYRLKGKWREDAGTSTPESVEGIVQDEAVGVESGRVVDGREDEGREQILNDKGREVAILSNHIRSLTSSSTTPSFPSPSAVAGPGIPTSLPPSPTTPTFPTPSTSRFHAPRSPLLSKSLQSISPSFLSRSRPRSNSSSPPLSLAITSIATQDGAEQEEDSLVVKPSWKTRRRIQLEKLLRGDTGNSIRPSSSTRSLRYVRPGTGTPRSLSTSTSSSSLFVSPIPSSHSLAPASTNSLLPTSRHRSLSAPILRNSSPLSPSTTSSFPIPGSNRPNGLSTFTTALSSPYETRAPSPILTSEPEPLPVNLFDSKLPRELKVKIFKMVIDVCEEEMQRKVKDGTWRGQLANGRWQGRAAGLREVIRIGRVSRAWRSLSLDGQIWSDLPVSIIGADILPLDALTRIFMASGSFVRNMDLREMSNVDGKVLLDLVNLSLSNDLTSFTSLDLRGCKFLTALSLDYLISHSPHLQHVNLSGLSSVRTETITSLGRTATHLISVDVCRCSYFDPSSLLTFGGCATSSTDYPGLKVLRASAINLTNNVLISIGQRFSRLEVLDVGYNQELTDTAFHSIVTVDSTFEGPMITLRPHQVGTWALNPSGDNFKRLLRWRHLSVSGCIGMSDRGMHYLAHAVPDLEFLEMARIGRSLRSQGLVALFATTRNIRRLDLEDAAMLSDEVLKALTPPRVLPPSAGKLPFPGEQLEYLNLSSCITLTDASLAILVQSCPNLIRLELDSSALGEGTARQFIDLCRIKQVTNGVLSILDSRNIHRRLTRDLGTRSRPRLGQRGFLFAPSRYHDEPGGLQECNPSAVVVRSLHSSLFLDQVDLERDRIEKKESARRLREGTRSLSCNIS